MDRGRFFSASADVKDSPGFAMLAGASGTGAWSTLRKTWTRMFPGVRYLQARWDARHSGKRRLEAFSVRVTS
jgi:hypothetical protein